MCPSLKHMHVYVSAYFIINDMVQVISVKQLSYYKFILDITFLSQQLLAGSDKVVQVSICLSVSKIYITV